MPTCGTILILPAVLKRRGPFMRQGLCSQLAHLWATSDFAPPPPARSKAVGTPKGDKGYAVTRPTSGPPPFLPPL